MDGTWARLRRGRVEAFQLAGGALHGGCTLRLDVDQLLQQLLPAVLGRDRADLIAEICGHGQEELVAAEAAHQRPQLADFEELGLVRVEAAVELGNSAGPVLQLLLIPEAVVQQELDHRVAGVCVDIARGLQGRQCVLQPGFIDPGHGSPR